VPMKARDAAQALQQKGFKEERGRDHIYYFFYRNGVKTRISTKISHNEKDLTDNLCKFMARQTQLSLSQFRNLVDCSMSGQDYLAHLMKIDYFQTAAQAAPAPTSSTSPARSGKKR
jgi:predicted RNA binding protein YcfA (HicA-like mRNA interferase family)